MSLLTDLNQWRDYSNSPEGEEEFPPKDRSSHSRNAVSPILPIASYENIHIPLEAIYHYDFLEQDKFIEIFENRIKFLGEQIDSEAGLREQIWQEFENKRKQLTKRERKLLQKQTRLEQEYKGKAKMGHRERVLRNKRRRCQERLVLCKKLLAMGVAFPFEKLSAEMRLHIFSFLLVKPEPIIVGRKGLHNITKNQAVWRVSRQFRIEAADVFFRLNTFQFNATYQMSDTINNLATRFVERLRKITFSWPRLDDAKAADSIIACTNLSELTIILDTETYSWIFGYGRQPCKKGHLASELFKRLSDCHALKSVAVIRNSKNGEFQEFSDDDDSLDEFKRSNLECCLREKLVPCSDEAKARPQKHAEILSRLKNGEIATDSLGVLKMEWELIYLGYDEELVKDILETTNFNSRLALESMDAELQSLQPALPLRAKDDDSSMDSD